MFAAPETDLEIFWAPVLAGGQFESGAKKSEIEMAVTWQPNIGIRERLEQKERGQSEKLMSGDLENFEVLVTS